MQMINVITIDGPSASGKGALARNIAHQFGLNILDSGVLYRLFAYFDILNVSYEEIASKIDNEINFKLEKDILKILFQDKDISFELRSEEIAKVASKLSSKKEVRDLLYDIQRNFYNSNGLVADGRDMGTVVFKDAKLKIFLTASSKVRAKRRYLELQNRGQEVNMPSLIADIESRDLKDSSRKLSPLLPADDANIIDSSDMSLEEVFSFTESLIKKEFI
ncbi:MAG: cytidylate kinase [Gammaproteobacteria bacterium TMED226]|nr:MAG: cytidylate kinase [Gammaproteobacteria bacterium TMED226]|tara:strand:- start:379 stop:1038 length:660 start_codon:yes stop_codon:yes gene_type:complete